MELIPISGPREPAGVAARLPALFLPDGKASGRFWEFFTVNIRNKNTRRAYYNVGWRFAAWCEGRGLHELAKIRPVHVAAYVEELQTELPLRVFAGERMSYENQTTGCPRSARLGYRTWMHGYERVLFRTQRC